MSKELTEKWNDRDLPNGLYYVKEFDGKIYRFEARGGILWRDSNNPVYASERIEVLAPVPRYDEYEELVRKANKLDIIMSDTTTNPLDCMQIEIDNLNRQIERLQEQLEEANEVINNMKLCMDDKYDYDCVAEDVDVYIEKWGVK